MWAGGHSCHRKGQSSLKGIHSHEVEVGPLGREVEVRGEVGQVEDKLGEVTTPGRKRLTDVARPSIVGQFVMGAVARIIFVQR